MDVREDAGDGGLVLDPVRLGHLLPEVHELGAGHGVDASKVFNDGLGDFLVKVLRPYGRYLGVDLAGELLLRLLALPCGLHLVPCLGVGDLLGGDIALLLDLQPVGHGVFLSGKRLVEDGEEALVLGLLGSLDDGVHEVGVNVGVKRTALEGLLPDG